MRKLLLGVMMRYKILTSEITIQYLPDAIVIKFIYYKYKRSQKVKPLIYFLELLLSKVTGRKIYIAAIQVPSYLYSAKILTEYIKLEHIR